MEEKAYLRLLLRVKKLEERVAELERELNAVEAAFLKEHGGREVEIFSQPEDSG